MTDVGGILMPTWALWIVSIATVVGAASVIWHKAVKPLFRLGKLIHKTYEKVMEYDDRLSVVENHTVQLKNNGGSSLRDAVDRIEARQKTDAELFAKHIDWANSELTQVWKQIAARDVMQSAERTADKIDEGIRRH